MTAQRLRVWIVCVMALPALAHAQGISPRLKAQLEAEAAKAQEEADKADKAAAAPQVPAEPPALSSADSAERLAEVTRIGRQRDATQAASVLRVLVEDPDAEVRSAAAWALGRMHHEPAAAQLSNALTADSSRRVRRSAALALGELSTAGSVAALVGSLKDPDEQVAAAAAEALGRSGKPDARAPLSLAAKDERALVSLTAKRALATLPKAPPSEKQEVAAAWFTPWCKGDLRSDWMPVGLSSSDCRFKRDQSDRANGDAFFVLSSTLLGGAAGAFSLDGIRPSRRGVRITPKRTFEAADGASPLERAVAGTIGAVVGAGASGLWVLFDDVTLSRAGLIALMTAEGMVVGAAVGAALSTTRTPTVGPVAMTGLVSGLAAAAITWGPHDFSYGDVSWVYANAALGMGVGILGALTLIPSRVGRPRGREGYLNDVGELVGLPFPVAKMPFGEITRLEVALMSGVATSATASLFTASTIGFYEVGVARALKTVGAAAFVSAMIGVPLALLFPDPPLGLPTGERVGTGLGLVSGLSAGMLMFFLSPNDEGQGPLLAFDLPGNKDKKDTQATAERVVLSAPTMALVPPTPGVAGDNKGGVYVGLVNARY